MSANDEINWSKPAEIKELEKHVLEDKTKYSRCVLCWKEGRKTGKTADVLMGELKPLVYYKQIYVYKAPNGSSRSDLVEFYFCENCRRRTTVEDYEKAWCKPYASGSK